MIRKLHFRATALCALAFTLSATAASAQTTQTVQTSNGTREAFVTDIVLNGNNAVLWFEDHTATTTSLLNTGITLTYDDPLSISDVKADTKAHDEVYDLQGRRMNRQTATLPKGIYIVNGKKQVVR